MKAGRVGDEAKCPEDGHAHPCCKHVTVGPSTHGSPNVFINNQPVMRFGDPGEHTETCCGKNTWRATGGSSTVTVNGLPLHRVGDETAHCGGKGKLITGSGDVLVGDGGNGAASHDKKGAVSVRVTDAFDRPLKGVVVRVLSPEGMEEKKFDGDVSLSGMHKGTTVIVEKDLQHSQADEKAVKGIVPAGTRMITPRKKPAATPSPKTSAPSARAASTGGAAAPADTSGGAGDHHKAHVPASNGTSKTPSVATVHRPEGEKVDVVQFTVHNWVQAVYTAFKIPFPTGVWETATLGVREASMLGEGTQREDQIGKDEEEAAAGHVSAKGGKGEATQTRAERVRTITHANARFDDTLYIVWTESTAHHDQKVEVFECTVDPEVATNPAGHPFLLEGFEYQLVGWVHHPAKYPNPYGGNDAYQVRDKGPKETTTIVRTHGKRVIAARPDLSGPMVRHETPGINVHFGGRNSGTMAENIGRWSAGCTVLRHALHSERYGRFVQIIHKSKSKPRPYVIVSSQYIRLYHEWVDYCNGDKAKAQDPKSVLREDVLKDREIGGKYIPSILDVKFAKENPKLVAPALFSTAT